MTLEQIAAIKVGNNVESIPELVLLGSYLQVSSIWYGRTLRDGNGKPREITWYTACRVLRYVIDHTTKQSLRFKAQKLLDDMVINQKDAAHVA